MDVALLLNLYYFFNIINQMACSFPAVYRKGVPKNSIIRAINVTSISSCLFQCWDDLLDGCVAVGFNPDELNKSNLRSVTCYMIAQGGESDEIVVLSIFVSIPLYQVNFGKKEMLFNITMKELWKIVKPKFENNF